jgi:hypothetical protein
VARLAGSQDLKAWRPCSDTTPKVSCARPGSSFLTPFGPTVQLRVNGLILKSFATLYSGEGVNSESGSPNGYTQNLLKVGASSETNVGTAESLEQSIVSPVDRKTSSFALSKLKRMLIRMVSIVEKGSEHVE